MPRDCPSFAIKQEVIKLSSSIKKFGKHTVVYTVELKWLEHLWDHENLFETGVVRVNESLL